LWLFIVVTDVITKEIREGLPWEILYADDLVLIVMSMEELKDKILRWKETHAYTHTSVLWPFPMSE
jgi:hypothetical protein